MSLLGGGRGNGGLGSRGVASSSSSSRQPIRRSAAFDDDEEDDFDEQQQQRNGHRRRADEAVVGYSHAGAETKHKHARATAAAPPTIAKQDDGNWMEERKRRLGLGRYRKELGSLSSGLGGANGSTSAAQTTDRIGHEEQHVGLQLRRAEHDDDERADVDMTTADTPPVSQAAPSPPIAPPLDDDDDDAAARAALLLGGADRSATDERVIIAPAAQPYTEEEALQRDVDARPDEPTLDDYAKMPVEAFGAALLRGMGWREGMGAGKQRQGPTTAPDVKKRAALLGLGAKEREIDAAAAAAHRKPGGGGTHAQRPERRYVPVIRREGEQSSPSSSTRHRDRSRSPPSRRERESREDSRDSYRSRDGDRHRHSDDRRTPSSASDRDRHHRRRHDDDNERRHRQTHDYKDDRRDRHARH